MLQGSETWETDDISVRLDITMDGKSNTIRLERGDGVYMSGGGCSSPLQIYIPHEETAQDVCVQHALPRKLVEWLMTPPPEGREPGLTVPIDERAVGVVKGLLNARFASVPRILTQEGIHEIAIPNTDADKINVVAVTEEVAEPLTPQTRWARSVSSSGSTSVGVFTPGAANPETPETPASDPFSAPSPSSPPPLLHHSARAGYFRAQDRSPEFAMPVVESTLSYRKLLDHVIWAGQQIRFPKEDASDVSPLAGGALSNDTFAGSQFTTFQLGAAGELFVR